MNLKYLCFPLLLLVQVTYAQIIIEDAIGKITYISDRGDSTLVLSELSLSAPVGSLVIKDDSYALLRLGEKSLYLYTGIYSLQEINNKYGHSTIVSTISKYLQNFHSYFLSKKNINEKNIEGIIYRNANQLSESWIITPSLYLNDNVRSITLYDIMGDSIISQNSYFGIEKEIEIKFKSPTDSILAEVRYSDGIESDYILKLHPNSSELIELKNHIQNIGYSDKMKYNMFKHLFEEYNLILDFHQLRFSENRPSQKWGFLIGVDKYKYTKYSERGFSRISSDRDIELMQQVLYKNGFKKDHIQILSNKDASYNKLVHFLGDSILYKINKNDKVYIHFSLHGQRVKDFNADEVDGLDEALAPYDAMSRYKKGIYEGEKHIIDDSLKIWIQQISSKIGAGGHLLVIFDSCFSGNSLRSKTDSTITLRGINDIIASQSFLDSIAVTVNTEANKLDLLNPGINNITAIYASSFDEKNSERYDDSGRKIGSLSYALAKSLMKYDFSIPLLEIFKYVQTEMKFNIYTKNQTPSMEGLSTVSFFNQNKLEPENVISVSDILKNNRVVVNVGTINGILIKDSIVLKDFEGKYINSGCIVETDFLFSTATLNEPIIDTFNVISSHVSISKNTEKENIQIHNTRLDVLPSTDLIFLYNLIELNQQDSFALINTNENTLRKDHISVISQMKNDIELVSNLNSIPIDQNMCLNLNIVSLEAKESINSHTFYNNDLVEFRISNRCNEPYYYSVICIGEDLSIQQTIPYYNHEEQKWLTSLPSAYKLSSNQAINIKYKFYTTSNQKEQYLLLTSKVPINLENIYKLSTYENKYSKTRSSLRKYKIYRSSQFIDLLKKQ